jgi:hypothetical protein
MKDVKIWLAEWVAEILLTQLARYDIFENHDIEVTVISPLLTQVKLFPLDGRPPRYFNVKVSEVM